MWWRERGRLALDDEGYLWLMPVAGDEDTPTRKLGHVEDDPPLPDDLADGEAGKEWLAAERSAEHPLLLIWRDWSEEHHRRLGLRVGR